MGAFREWLLQRNEVKEAHGIPIKRFSSIKMKHSKNVCEYIDRFNHIRLTVPNTPYLTHIITWFILGLTQGI